MSNSSYAVIFKKNLTKPKDFEVCFTSIAKNELIEFNRQSMWVEIKDLVKFDTDTEKQKPNAITRGVLNALNTSRELSIWARMKISEGDAIKFSDGLRVPIDHISLTFS